MRKLQFQLKDCKYKVDLRLKTDMTGIYGESGSGKTYLYNIIKTHESLDRTGKILCIDDKNKYDAIRKLNVAEESIIVIDQANHVLGIEEIRKLIAKDCLRGNYYILIGRQLPIQIRLSEMAQMHIKDDVISISYDFGEA